MGTVYRVGCAVEGEDARNLDRRVAVGVEGAGVVLGSEGDVGEFRGLEDIELSIFLVTAGVAGVAAGGRDDDGGRREQGVARSKSTVPFSTWKVPLVVSWPLSRVKETVLASGLMLKAWCWARAEGRAEQRQRGCEGYKEGAWGRLHRVSP